MFFCQKTSGEGQLCIMHYALKKFLCLKKIMFLCLIYSRKNSETPATEMRAPITLFRVMGCLNSHQAGRIMMMGVSAMRVLAMPALVYCTASNEHPTPTKGPKMVVKVATVMLVRSVMFLRSDAKPSRNRNNKAKPTIPAMQRNTLA